MRTLRSVVELLMLLAILVSGGCDGVTTRTISADFFLERSESGNVYLQYRHHEVDGVGWVEGTVLEIGWNSDVILLRRNACVQGEPDGWFAVRLLDGKVQGPLSDTKIRLDFREIRVKSVAEIWGRGE